MSKRHFGAVDGVAVGRLFASRHELSLAGVHRPTQAGISGSGKEAADSIVLSGGYEDDEDFGDVIVYTGHGGRDLVTNEQTSDQRLQRGNLALARNKLLGLPVRVIRGAKHDSPHSPPHGYRYDGLFYVEAFWRERGRSGHVIWRYRLVAEHLFLQAGLAIAEAGEGYETVPRVTSTIVRVVRDTALSRDLKALYNYHCQVCGVRLEGSAGPYAEAAHIRPLGAPHNGPDTFDNLLCLCPNHHVLFDYGAFAIADDFRLLGLEGALHLHPTHRLSQAHLRYHRQHLFLAI